MIGSWRNQKKMMHQEAPSLDRESRNWERKNSNPGRLFPRAIIVFFTHCCVLNVRSIIKCGSIKYYWKTRLNWRGKVLTLEGNTLGTPPPNKSKRRGGMTRTHRADSSTQFPTAFLLWEERHPPKGQMSAGPGHCPRLPSTAFPDFTDASFHNG